MRADLPHVPTQVQSIQPVQSVAKGTIRRLLIRWTIIIGLSVTGVILAVWGISKLFGWGGWKKLSSKFSPSKKLDQLMTSSSGGLTKVIDGGSKAIAKGTKSFSSFVKEPNDLMKPFHKPINIIKKSKKNKSKTFNLFEVIR
jgi:hypothetical protein